MISNTLIFMSISLSSPKIGFMHNEEKNLEKYCLTMMRSLIIKMRLCK
ncbi:hypothetical protein VKI21_05850 [Cyanobacterium aponinum UTEX 3222]|uniref:Uncharacterized protein n=1 Tax=Cyanobacterium aponinum AL20115 TaxID=3090662 RepID=A0AAF0ZFC3_9CHRO|nr:hypothetical protein [Cyanobacterium aponinum]WPF87812.1 hypothetical protein SAY89_13535 [Cyanobacterium aponinum AL20115]WRL43206.1 hypothetical protein VKI21_05850 [Cyanobacterium aponinum UTEX 3222]